MPNKDGTGPTGQWAKTGRGMWKCEKKDLEQKDENYGKKNWDGLCQWRWKWNGGRRCEK